MHSHDVVLSAGEKTNCGSRMAGSVTWPPSSSSNSPRTQKRTSFPSPNSPTFLLLGESEQKYQEHVIVDTLDNRLQPFWAQDSHLRTHFMLRSSALWPHYTCRHQQNLPVFGYRQANMPPQSDFQWSWLNLPGSCASSAVSFVGVLTFGTITFSDGPF